MATSRFVTDVPFMVRDASRPLVVLGPSLGTSVTALWEDVIERLTPHIDVVGWDLPGHGAAPALDGPVVATDLTIARLAHEVAGVAARAQKARGALPDAPYWYAGVSVGGAVGLQLLLDQPGSIQGAVLLNTGASIGSPEMWDERAALVEKAGTPTQVEGSAQRWFADGFIADNPDVAARLLAALQTADRHGYAAVCRALGDFDVRDRLGEIEVPVLGIAGASDTATPVATVADMAAGAPQGKCVVLQDVAHLAPAEAPAQVAEAILDFVADGAAEPGTHAARQASAMSTRREVLGEAHVSGAVERTSAFTADFQELITRYAWGEIWGRPGLDRRLRSVATLTALIAGHHWEEFPMHVRAALRNGLTEGEIREVLLQSAIYCSVPSANRAFAIADEVLREETLDS